MEYTYDVFISYSSKDQKVVEGICTYLEQHHIRCFVAYRDIPAGVVWASAIVKGLDNSRMMLVVFSDNFNTSKQVDREIELASEDQKPILTFRITDDAFMDAKKYYLKNINWIDAFPNPELSFGHLLHNICRLLGIEGRPKPTGEQRKRPAPENSTSEQFDETRLYSLSNSEKIVYLRKCAEQGDADAQKHLGNLYQYGEMVAKDTAEAVKWYRKAAKQGHPGAQYQLLYDPEVAEKASMVAVLRCNGLCANRPRTNEYDSVASCRMKAGPYSGDTDCRYGCLGCGDCVSACAFGALSMDPETGLPVIDEEKCTACGACVKACPKALIELRKKGPRGMRVYVSCVNKDKGAVARKACKAACIGCGKCAKVCPHGAITVVDNVAYIDFTKCKLCKKCVAECPTGAIHAVNFPVVKPKQATDQGNEIAINSLKKLGY